MRVLLLTARDPLEAGDGALPARLAARLAEEGHEVVLVLLEDAVALCRPAHRDAAGIAAALGAGVRVLAEEEALARRAVHLLVDGVKPAELGEVVDLLMGWSDRRAWI